MKKIIIFSLFVICFIATNVSAQYEYETKISLHPNPASTECVTVTSQNIESIRVYNVLGSEIFVHTQIADSRNTAELHVSKLESGQYFVVIKTTDSNKTTTLRLTKQN